MLAAESMSKSFGGAQALRAVSATFRRGEVVALVGENGAGKSTLLKVLAAVTPQDSGSATLDGKPYAPANQREAEARGVALVFQELNVNLALGIAENVMLGRLRSFRRFGLIDWKRLNAAAQQVLDRIGAGISVRQDIGSLDLGQIKTIEVARALASQPQFIFFDESTAFLSHAEAQRLLASIGQLRAEGIGVAFVSHHLQEVFEIADRMIVLKDGALVGSYPAQGMTETRLQELMVGRDLVGGLFPDRARSVGRVALAVSDLRMAGGLGPITLDLRCGEVLGIGGIKGSGGDRVLAALTGAEPVTGGRMQYYDAPYAPREPREAWAHGIAALPGDRTGEGVVAGFSVGENLTLAARPRRAAIFTDPRAATRMAQTQVRALNIKTQGLEMPVASLSGGNMQKVVLGKCLAVAPKVLLLNNPTRGVDVGARAEIYHVIRRMAESGVAVLMVTEDLPELIGLSDRILVTRRGRIARSFAPGERPGEEEVVKWMM